jgi:integrase
MTLTARQVEAAKPRDKAYKLSDAKGLYLFVSPTGAKSWRANYTEGGKQKTRTYGLWPEVSLAQARERHDGVRKAAPAVTKAKVPTFKEVAKRWLLKHLPSLSNSKHRSQVEGTLEQYAYPTIGHLPLDEIERKQLAKIVLDIQQTGKVETAHRVAGRMTAVFDFAVDAGEIEKHAASHLSRVLTSKKVKKHMPSIHKSEAGELMRKILEYPEPVTRLGLLLAAHTFVRVKELRGFHEDELTEEGAIWVVPAERMKMGLPHVVPLTPIVQGWVRELQAMSATGLLLASPAKPGQPISENTLLFALYRMGYKGRMTVHGFRALASTVLNEESGFSRDVIERQLAHKETDAVRAAYNRAEYLSQRRELMAWWSAWLVRAAQDQKPANG